MRRNPRLTFVASVSLASLICNTSQAAITVIYSGYVHDALGSQPAAAAGFNTGGVITNGNPSSAHGGSVTTSDNLSTTTRSFGTSYTGDTTTILNATANVQSVSVFNDPAYSGNKQIDGGYFRYIGFTVGVTDSYTFTGSLKSRNSTVTIGSSGYAYYGFGGSASLEVNNGPNPNTALFDSGGSGNQGDPAANTTVFSFTTIQVLTAGVTYQINFGNYMYSGFDGTGGVERNSGWDVVLTQVPEPSSMLLSFAGMAGLALVRRRA